MEHKENILPSLAFVSALSESSNDIYDVLAALSLFALRDKGLMSFDREEATNTINRCYGFSLPSAVINSAIRRLCDNEICEKKNKGKFSFISREIEESYTGLKQENDSLTADYDYIIEEIYDFSTNYMHCDISHNALKKLFFSMISGSSRSEDTDYSTLIELFLVHRQYDERISRIINSIKTGCVIYNGVCSTPELNTLGGWTKEMRLFLATDVLFSLFGINGDLNKERASYFISLTKEINSNKQIIWLYILSSTQKEIDDFFFAAESIASGKTRLDQTKQGMSDLLKDCPNVDDVIRKKVAFQRMLLDLNINRYDREDIDDMKPYYLGSLTALEKVKEELKTQKMIYNESEILNQMAILEKINAFRRGNSSIKFIDAKFFYVTSKALIHLIAQNPSFKYKEKDIPLASNIYFLTEKFWFALNKGFSEKNIPSSFDMVAKAKTAISVKLAESVSNKFSKLNSEMRNGSLSEVQARDLYIEYLSRIAKAENIIPDMVKSIFEYISDDEIAQHVQEKSALRAKAEDGEAAKVKLNSLYQKELNKFRTQLKQKYKKQFATTKLISCTCIGFFSILIFILIQKNISDNLLVSIAGGLVLPTINAALNITKKNFSIKSLLWKKKSALYIKELKENKRILRNEYEIN